MKTLSISLTHIFVCLLCVFVFLLENAISQWWQAMKPGVLWSQLYILLQHTYFGAGCLLQKHLFKYKLIQRILTNKFNCRGAKLFPGIVVANQSCFLQQRKVEESCLCSGYVPVLPIKCLLISSFDILFQGKNTKTFHSLNVLVYQISLLILFSFLKFIKMSFSIDCKHHTPNQWDFILL